MLYMTFWLKLNSLKKFSMSMCMTCSNHGTNSATLWTLAIHHTKYLLTVSLMSYYRINKFSRGVQMLLLKKISKIWYNFTCRWRWKILKNSCCSSSWELPTHYEMLILICDVRQMLSLNRFETERPCQTFPLADCVITCFQVNQMLIAGAQIAQNACVHKSGSRSP